WQWTTRVIAIGLLAITAIAVWGVISEVRVCARRSGGEGALPSLFVAPPIDAYQPVAPLLDLDAAGWLVTERDRKQRIMIRYMHDCMREGDRVLVTGSTPYQVGYYV